MLGLPLVDRGTEDDGVRPLHLLDPLVDLVTLHGALLVLVFHALIARDASPDRLVAHLHDLGLDPLFLKLGGHQVDGMTSVPFGVGAAVKCHYFHNCSSRFG